MFRRRKFIKKTAALSIATIGIGMNGFSNPLEAKEYSKTPMNEINIVGPKKGYTPEIGTLVSMMNWMRGTILRPLYGMSVKDLDYLNDDNSNSVGAMLMHLVATERFYQKNTFLKSRHFEPGKKEDKMYDIASGLGDAGRKEFKGKGLEYYLEKLENCRAFSLKELAQYEDSWLEKIDTSFWGSPTNNYCKWFHVVEHESNHNGQIKYLKSRLHSRK